MFLTGFIITFIVARLVGIVANNTESYQENRGLSGVHLKVAIYHVSSKKTLFEKASLFASSKIFFWSSLFVLFHLKEPPIFSIIRDPTNSSVVHYVGFPKIVFDLLAASQNFTFV